MPLTTPSPQTWTLRCKHNKTTIVLHVDALQTLSSIKPELLQALRDTQPDGSLNGHALPEDAAEIQLAKMLDPHDETRGWVRVDNAETKVGKKKDGPSLKDVGLKDNGVLAFRWGEEAANAPDQILDEDEGEQWDVIMPKYEETYFPEDEGVGSA
ncbi:uncharacterized protein K452DRAFT_285238 [Aplosporella prunicola CBS 121167]|uniref:Uncharacterized protein n=1 Tax=Aplosporella prunicola CBS 121167 TaxID=1176127 RepID=A0A6A6BNB0_9PEZI|nr:uncharacterized protein K452DRAFT_285238 [Aplosporella prunicola CBS 121167]KAF2144031.1 hypothetical protein K452DRAFT_285238 [Aplosporella prunicola CBS 121167]